MKKPAVEQLRRFGVITSALLLLCLPGCASLRESAAPTSATPLPSSETATATSVPATSTSAAVTKAMLPTGDSLRRSPGTTFSGCDPDGRDKFSTGEVFDPQTGVNLPLPKPTLAAPEQLVKQRCTVAGDPKSLRVVYVLATRTPA